MNVLDYVQAWRLTDPQPLAKTATSDLYKVRFNGEPSVLKIFTPLGIRDEKSGTVALRCFGGEAAVRLLRYDDRAQLLEYAEGEDLKSLVQRGDDRTATLIIGDLLNRLHSAYKGLALESLTPLEARFRSLFRRAECDKREGLSSVYSKAADAARTLLSAPKDLRILHGDMHHENVRYSGARGWLAIDPKGLFGERTYDAANVLCNPAGMDDFVADEDRLMKNAGILAQVLKIDTTRLLAFTFAHAALSASWSLEDSQNPALALRIAAIAEPHVRI
jgi:streptomycin 6-kinase